MRMQENLSKYLHLINKNFKCSQPHNTSFKFYRIDRVNFILEKLIQLTKKLTQTIKNNKMHAIKVQRLCTNHISQDREWHCLLQSCTHLPWQFHAVTHYLGLNDERTVWMATGNTTQYQDGHPSKYQPHSMLLNYYYIMRTSCTISISLFYRTTA